MTSMVLAVALIAAVATHNTMTVTVQVKGMSCGSCAAAVRHVLKEINGVRDSRVSYEEGTAVISYDPTKVTPEQIAQSAGKKLPAFKFLLTRRGVPTESNQPTAVSGTHLLIVQPLTQRALRFIR